MTVDAAIDSPPQVGTCIPGLDRLVLQGAGRNQDSCRLKVQAAREAVLSAV